MNNSIEDNEDKYEHSNDMPMAMGVQNSQSDLMHQQLLDFDMLAESIDEMLRNIRISFEKKTETFVIETLNEDKRQEVQKEYLALTLGELNTEAFNHLQEYNLNLSLCVLKKAVYFCTVSIVYLELPEVLC